MVHDRLPERHGAVLQYVQLIWVAAAPVPRMLRNMKCCADPGSIAEPVSIMGPGSAEQRDTLHRVRDTRERAANVLH
jgi:hypothetical protein